MQANIVIPLGKHVEKPSGRISPEHRSQFNIKSFFFFYLDKYITCDFKTLQTSELKRREDYDACTDSGGGVKEKKVKALKDGYSSTFLVNAKESLVMKEIDSRVPG